MGVAQGGGGVGQQGVAGAAGVAQGGGGVGQQAVAGADAAGAQRIVDPFVSFKCPTCTLKDDDYKLSFVRRHTKECIKALKERQEFLQARAAEREKKAAAHRKPKKKSW